MLESPYPLNILLFTLKLDSFLPLYFSKQQKTLA